MTVTWLTCFIFSSWNKCLRFLSPNNNYLNQKEMFIFSSYRELVTKRTRYFLKKGFINPFKTDSTHIDIEYPFWNGLFILWTPLDIWNVCVNNVHGWYIVFDKPFLHGSSWRARVVTSRRRQRELSLPICLEIYLNKMEYNFLFCRYIITLML